MGRIVIACYKPKPGKEIQLDELVQQHYRLLQEQGLVSIRKPAIMKAENETVVEVFEWASKEAVEAAHTNEAVMEIWERFGEVCDYIPIAQVPEGQQVFSEFEGM